MRSMCSNLVRSAALSVASLGVLAGVTAASAVASPTSSSPSAREVQSAVDAYLSTAQADAALVGGPGQAGYDNGFWIRGGSFLLKINLTLQARWEGFDWDDSDSEPSPGGDLSGFSLPRATLKFSGDATCDVHYYTELEFGHSGAWFQNQRGRDSITSDLLDPFAGVPRGIFGDGLVSPEDLFGILREGWIEYETSPYFAIRMGLVKTPTTRQLMTPPELQQFVDISMASAFLGQVMPGYTDRNRDYGLLMHGAFGCDAEFQYMVAITNGDGVVRRNVLDGFTSDNFAYSARFNWDIKGHLGYEEGALRSHECEWAASIGAWGHFYADAALHNPFEKFADRLAWGVDAAFLWGGLSVTAAYSAMDWDGGSGFFTDISGFAYLFQAGYLFPGTAWELAARYAYYEGGPDGGEIGGTEIGVAVTYYIDGHADKVTLDVAFISGEENGHFLADTYAAYEPTDDGDGVLVRLQWQLAL